jgi:hypothetical protein
MFFSEQGIMGFGCQALISELQSKLYAEKHTDSQFQEGIPDRKTFLDFMSQAAEQGLFLNHSGNRQEDGMIHEDLTEKKSLDFRGPEPKADDKGHFLEIHTKTEILHYMNRSEMDLMILKHPEEPKHEYEESGMELLSSQDLDKEPMILKHPEEPKHAYEKSNIKPIILQVVNDLTEIPVLDHLELVSKNDFIVSVPENQIKNKWDTVKIFEDQAEVKPRTQEPKAGTDIKQLIDLLSNELENKPAVDNEKSDVPLKVFVDQDKKIPIEKNVLQNIPVNLADFNLQAIKETGQTISNPVFQAPHTLDMVGAANHQSSQITQSSQTAQVAMTSIQDTYLGPDVYGVERKVLGQVVVRLFKGVRQGSQNMTIHLYPPELGKVKVRIVSDKGDLSVRLHSMNQQVGGILEKYLPLLQQSLEDQGLSLSDLRVTVESGNEEKSGSDKEKFLWENRKFSVSDLSEKNQETGVSGENIIWPAPSQGLSLRV